jgi:hypothetical protein
LTICSELAVLAHLVNKPVPQPTADTRRILPFLDLSPKLIMCAISQAVDNAIVARTGVMQAETDPHELAMHVTTVVSAILKGAPPVCQGGNLHKGAQPYRWNNLHYILSHSPGGDLPGPHPNTESWEQLYRRPIPGASRAEQLATVTAWRDADQRDPKVIDVVTYGAHRPSTLETAIGATLTDSQWPQLAQDALRQFDTCAWVPTQLTADSDGM